MKCVINDWKMCLDLNCLAFRKARKYPQSLEFLYWSARAADSLTILHHGVCHKYIVIFHLCMARKMLGKHRLKQTIYSFWTSFLLSEKLESCNRASLRDFYAIPFYDSTLSILAAKDQYQNPKPYYTPMRENGLCQHWNKKMEMHN